MAVWELPATALRRQRWGAHFLPCQLEVQTLLLLINTDGLSCWSSMAHPVVDTLAGASSL